MTYVAKGISTSIGVSSWVLHLRGTLDLGAIRALTADPRKGIGGADGSSRPFLLGSAGAFAQYLFVSHVLCSVEPTICLDTGGPRLQQWRLLNRGEYYLLGGIALEQLA